MTLAESIVKYDVLELEVRDGEDNLCMSTVLSRDQFIELIPRKLWDYDIDADDLHDFISISTCTVSTWESMKEHLRLTLFTGRTNSIPQ